MLDLKHLTDEALISEAKRLVRVERDHLTVILSHLHEIERRKLFSSKKCESMRDYAMKEFGYSRDEADRRISAMRAIRGVPEVEAGIASGELNLTHINIAQRMFNSEKRHGREFTCEKKAEVFEAIAGQSTREAQKTLFEFAPEAPRQPDQVKPVGKGRYQMKSEITEETHEKYERLKGRLAHQNLDFDQILNRLCDLGLEHFDPAKPAQVQRKQTSNAEIRREVFRRDKNKCTNCGSYHAVQPDHIIPKSMGGEYTFENLRLLCRSCNQRAAIEKLGQEKMDPYLTPAAPRFQQQHRRTRHPAEPLDRDRSAFD